MTRSSKRIRVAILNPPEGCQGTTSLEHARRYVRRGTAEWEGGAIRFVHRRRRQAQTPNVEVAAFRGGSDSGFSMLPYPMAHHTFGGLAKQYPTLARRGAGL